MKIAEHLFNLMLCAPFPILLIQTMPHSEADLFGDYIQYYHMGLGQAAIQPFVSRPLLPAIAWLLGGSLEAWAILNGVLFLLSLWVYLETFGDRAFLIFCFASLVRMPFVNLLWPSADASTYFFVALALWAAKTIKDERLNGPLVGFGIIAVAGLAHPIAFILCLSICFMRWPDNIGLWIGMTFFWAITYGQGATFVFVPLADVYKAALLTLNILLLGIVPLLKKLRKWNLDWWDGLVIMALFATFVFTVSATDTTRMAFHAAPFLAVNVAQLFPSDMTKKGV